MRWSWKIGQFRGIGVYMHATFLILIAFIVLNNRDYAKKSGKCFFAVALGQIRKRFTTVFVNLHNPAMQGCNAHLQSQGSKFKVATIAHQFGCSEYRRVSTCNSNHPFRNTGDR
jgi:hypothetical protein